jgi:hypothetical protein
MTDEEQMLWDALRRIHGRVQWIADQEALSAWVNGAAAQGSLMPSKMKLIADADQILDRIEAIKNA